MGTVLYLHEYESIPEEIVRWKNDEHLKAIDVPEHIPEVRKVCTGIGTYRTQKDGALYFSVFLDADTQKVVSWSFGVYRSVELVRRAADLFLSHRSVTERPLIVHSSGNPLYCTKKYKKMMSRCPVELTMSMPGERGGIAMISTFYAQLMRRKGRYVFTDWQDAVDWLTEYIQCYNRKKNEENHR